MDVTDRTVLPGYPCDYGLLLSDGRERLSRQVADVVDVRSSLDWRYDDRQMRGVHLGVGIG